MSKLLDEKLAIIDAIEQTMGCDDCTMDEKTLQVFCKLTESQLFTINLWLAQRVRALKVELQSER